MKLVIKMTYGIDWMNEKHSRTDVAHHIPDPLAHLWRITVNLAFPAAALPLPFRTMLYSGYRIGQQFIAIMAQYPLLDMMFSMTVNFNHHPYNPFIVVNPACGHINKNK